MNNTYKIKEAREFETGFDISTDEGICFYIDKKYNAVPKKGDKVTLHTVGGSSIRGIDLNDQQLFYKTDEQLETERKEWLENYTREKQEKFEKNKHLLDAQYDALPKAFQNRIDKFRKNNPDFRVDYEAYELFCCEQAVLIANACGTIEEIKELKEKSFEEQLAKVQGLSDSHSGNTIDCAFGLAKWYLSEPEQIVNLMGAMTPLVGSKDYGDVPQT